MKDSQRQKVYDAEKVALKTLRELGIVKIAPPLTIEEMTAVFNKMSLYNVKVSWFRSDASHCAYYNKIIRMIPRMATLWNIVHEGCHALVHRSYPRSLAKFLCTVECGAGVRTIPIDDVVGHGWQFANQLLCQIRIFLGDIAADALEGAYRKLNVKYFPPAPKRKYTHKKPVNTHSFSLEAWDKMTLTQKNVARYEDKKRQERNNKDRW